MVDTKINYELKIVDKDLLQKNNTFVNMSKVKEKAHPLTIHSFPRSGNTMLRTILENTTSILTGHDLFIPNKIEVNRNNLVNLEISGVENVTFIKTHYPITNFPDRQFSAQGVLLAVRNPFDAIESHFHFCATRTQDNYIKGEYSLEKLEDLCNYYVPKYQEFHEYIINDVVGKVPVYFLIYEDFNKDKISGIKDLFDFIFKFDFDKEYLGGQTHEDIKKKLNSENDIKKIIERVIYLPKDEKNKFRTIKQNNFFTDELKVKIITTCYSTLKYFNYIDELKELNNEVINKAIEKMETLEKENKTVYKYKYNSYKEINEVNQKLFKDFSLYDKQISRPSIVINENNSDLRIVAFQSFWGKIIV